MINHKSEQSTTKKRSKRAQAMVEYAIIAAFVVLAIVGVLTLFGPAIGNIFSNTVVNVLDMTPTPYPTIGYTQYNTYLTAIASYTPATFAVITNTPLP